MKRLANASSRDGHMAPSTTSKRDLGVVIPLVTAERERDSFFYRDSSFSNLYEKAKLSCKHGES